jgi:exodeoxyribonuclease V beta subunit
MKPFDLPTCPLEGVNLIEASAGTGKTYALAGLYVRFLVEKKFTVRQLLVITYTKAATAELKKRIREMIGKVRHAMRTGCADGPLFEAFLDRYREDEDRSRIAAQLSDVLANFDEAAIYTIHGFCQHLLADNAFASGMPFETEIIENQQTLEREFIEDFWRSHIYGNHPVIVRYALENKFHHGALLKLLRLIISRSDVQIIPDYDPLPLEEFEKTLEALRVLFSDFTGIWRQERENILLLLQDQALSGTTYGKKAFRIVMDIDTAMKESEPPVPLPDAFHKINADQLSRKTNKGKTTPRHEIFDLTREICQRAEAIEAILAHHLSALKKSFMEAVREGFPALKQKKNVLYYDDLLTRARQAIFDPGGERLADALRLQYPAVLIDEFQDTDPIQFAILQAVFIQKEIRTPNTVFYIGDPKQAIYSFRGADIFAYLRAARDVDEVYEMTCNWRSEPTLVRAVNALFGKPSRAFVYDAIGYHEISSARDPKSPVLKVDGDEPAGLHWWFAPSDEGGKPLGIIHARKRIITAVVAEVSRLLTDGRKKMAMIGARALTEKDIAILVRKNSEAVSFQEALGRAGISAVLYSSKSVFDSDEAHEMKRFVSGVLHFDHEGYVLAALTTSFFSINALDIVACQEDDERMDNWRQRFRQLYDTWHTKGFLTMFNAFLEQGSIRAKLASYENGERRLTNYGHLAELIHKAEDQERLRPNDLLGWLDEMSRSDETATEEQQLKLETDRDCVRIVTIHKSKGLEYPIVFCPFSWGISKSEPDNQPLFFHDENNDWRLMADLGSENFDANLRQYEKESLAENCRLLYVALTRAQNRCYFVWGNIKEVKKGAAAYLFHRSFQEANDTAGTTNEEMLTQMKGFCDFAPGDIHIAVLPDEPVIRKMAPERKTDPLVYSEFQGVIEHSKKVCSYSYLIRGRHDDAEDTEISDEVIRRWDSIDSDSEALQSNHFLNFPAGATSGILLHEILEELDFTRAGETAAETLVLEKLRKYNYERHWLKWVMSMLHELVSVNLDVEDHGGFSLSHIGQNRCLKELEFYFPLRDITPAALMSVIDQSELHRRQYTKARMSRRLNFPPVQGFMKGFVDLVFEYRGKFYLADWKSNDLGARMENYTADGLMREMYESFYDVQYFIYTVALDQYLKTRIFDYDYEKHFGGVYYFFLRGIHHCATGFNGIYFDRPDPKLVDQLKKKLLCV